MNLIERVKNIIVTPKTEWETISGEDQNLASVITTYIVPLAIVGAVCTFIGYGFIGVSVGFFKMKGIEWGIKMAIIQLVSVLIGAVVTTYVVDALAPSFGSEKNINKSAQIVAYSYTPSLVGAFLTIFPVISILGSLFGLYGIYLVYLGLGPMKKTPDDKKVIYMIVTFVVLIVISMIVGTILSAILGTNVGASKFTIG